MLLDYTGRHSQCQILLTAGKSSHVSLDHCGSMVLSPQCLPDMHTAIHSLQHNCSSSQPEIFSPSLHGRVECSVLALDDKSSCSLGPKPRLSRMATVLRLNQCCTSVELLHLLPMCSSSPDGLKCNSSMPELQVVAPYSLAQNFGSVPALHNHNGSLQGPESPLGYSHPESSLDSQCCPVSSLQLFASL